MFSRTPWRISRWNAETVSGTLVIGIGGGTAEIRLWNGAAGEGHTLHCAGVAGSLGIGLSLCGVSLPSSQLGFGAEIRTQGGRLYKNDLVVGGELTLDLLRDSLILVQGVELLIADEGQAGYLVLFASAGATLSTFLGLGGAVSQLLAVGTCRAATFLSVGQAGLPTAAVTGYRYTVLGGS